MATVQGAMEQLNSAGQGGGVYVVAGTYNESLTLHSRVSVFAGFNATTLLRDVALNVTTVSGGGAIGLTGRAVKGATVDGLTIRSAAARDFVAVGVAGSSVGVLLVGDSNVTISRSAIFAGAGMDGPSGTSAPGTAATQGGAGINGTNFSGVSCPTGGRTRAWRVDREDPRTATAIPVETVAWVRTRRAARDRSGPVLPTAAAARVARALAARGKTEAMVGSAAPGLTGQSRPPWVRSLGMARTCLPMA